MTFEEKLDTGYYESHSFLIIPMEVACSNCGHRQWPTDQLRYCCVCGYNVTKEVGQTLDRHRDCVKRIKEKEEKAKAEFKCDVLKEVGLQLHPQKDEIFNYVSEHYSTGSYDEMYQDLIKLAELFKGIPKPSQKEEEIKLAYSEGYVRGFEEGYSRGKSDGMDSGYAEGFNAGYEKASNDALMKERELKCGIL